MKVEQIYTGCIAHAAYYIENNGEAAIFDPLREVHPYIERAFKDNAIIKYVFETHFHADFVSGHLDLKAKANAAIVFGPTAKPNYEAIIAEEGQIFNVGNFKVKVIHTPGHTMESTTYLLIDENGKEHGIITGDTLFIGDVGRPDLAQHVIADLTEDKLARHLYHSLREKILPLSDELIVYPNHGAGSACGKMMSKETTDTLGHQKKTNYALQPMSEDQFVKAILTGLTPPPGYFPKNVLMNIKGYESLDAIINRGHKPLKVAEFELIANETQALVLDTRTASEFAHGFIPNSINIGLDGNFAQMVGELILDIKQEILLVTDEGKEYETMIRLSRVGYDNTIGYLKGGFAAWEGSGKEIDSIHRVNAKQLEEKYDDEDMLIIDVRRKSEFDAEHFIGAINIPLSRINDYLSLLPRDKAFAIHCAGGYRSMIAASILKQRGWNNFLEVAGGFKAIALTGIPRTAYIRPTTLL
ncbi:MAG: MBL fold metallo-hydrolase [Chitinophagaceae bacterium]|nr:MBL fold metallo-hydrolase [Chitinophagaceae bacterium]